MDNINKLIKSTSEIDPSNAINQNLKDADVIQIWDEVSHYIERFMLQSKGVAIPGFGTFSFVQKKVDIGNNKYVLTQRPVFAISEKFGQTHRLRYAKYPVAGQIPVHPLNYSAIANETAYKRDDIESCVRHVLQVFNRSVASRKNVEFTFTGIGKLQIRDYKVKMRFFKEFVNSCDGSGKVIEEMQNRPNTLDSVMSRCEVDRSYTRNTCVLPRINSRNGMTTSLDNFNNINGKQMETITEENNNNNNISDTEQSEKKAEQEALNNSNKSNQLTDDSKQLAPVVSLYSSDDGVATSNSQTKSSSDLKPVQPPPNFMMSTSDHQFRIPDAFPIGSNPQVNQNPPAPGLLMKSASMNNLLGPRKLESDLQLQKPSSKMLLGSLPSRATVSATPTSCGHYGAGQELCYLCHQRSKRNIPIYLHEEKKHREAEEQQLLQQYQHLKDTEKRMEEEAHENIRREERAKMDAFNMGVAEAIRHKKQERPKTSDISRSFVFRKRVRTPPKFVKQMELSEYLSKQIESKNKDHNAKKQEKDYIEKIEQLKLAEDLVQQREAYLRDKHQKQNNLKSALDYQVQNKAFQLPKGEPDGDVFGKNDMNDEKLAEIRQRERDTFLMHKDLVEQRKREELLRQTREQEMDNEMLDRMKEEYKYDRANRVLRMLGVRKNLENEWFNAYHDKKVRDLNERQHRMAPDGVLVHEQCDKYKRCAQCQRKLKNVGESNIWNETRYTSGCRVMV